MTAHTFTLAHVTHEAVDHLGGIGTVLHGLMTSPVYQQHVGRSILVGPTQTHLHTDPQARLGELGKVLYSSIDDIDQNNFAVKFRPVEWAFNVKIIYGTRTYHASNNQPAGQAEVLLIDVFQTNTDRLNIFKLRLWERFGIDSSRYDKTWDYEEYVRLAEPAYYALAALLDGAHLPCILFSHEFMGMPTALLAILEGSDQFRTVFHAHECATARHIVENHPGHDTMFYNVLDQARAQRLYVNQVFGDCDHLLRHALVKQAHLCDGIIAVGDRTKDELKFLDPHFDDKPIDLVYNGIPAGKVTLAQKLKSRDMLLAYAKSLLGHEPDILLTHVTRPVISKGLWRDLQVCSALDARLSKMKQSGVLFILTSAGGVRRQQDVLAMENQYDWPRQHHVGYPDLVGPEQTIHEMIEVYNQDHAALRVVLVNQFGWSAKCIGSRLPGNMTITDLRQATDVELGMATYEPFGISPLEPLGSGAICVISNCCGCSGFISHVAGQRGTANVILADYTQLPATSSQAVADPCALDSLKNMTEADRTRIELQVADQIADQLLQRLPADDTQRQTLLDAGQALVCKMGWDQVLTESLLPMLKRIV